MKPKKTQRKLAKNQKAISLSLSLALFLLCAITLPAFAEEKPKTTVGENTGLPLPRFASLKSNHINARSGPGDTYPVKAVYKRAGLPVEIVTEFKLWREIVDIEGEHNWVHKAMLSGNRTAIVTESSFAYSEPENSAATAKLEKGAQVKIKQCNQTSCQVFLGEAKGWIEKSKLWGVYANEVFD